MNTLKYLLISTRPKQWTKNLVIFLALIFSMNLYWDPHNLDEIASKLGITLAAFALFCLLSGSTYLINDLVDLKKDQEHFRKRKRPLPSGKLRQWHAIATAVPLTLISLAISFWLNFAFGLVALAYFALMVAYSLLLRRLVILDVFTIASGFVLRAVAGAEIIGVPISPWLYGVTFLGALFLSLTKRRQELALLGENSASHRETFEGYTSRLLEEMIAIVAAATIIAYSLYTFTAEKLPENHAMMLTIPFVIYGIMRYLKG